MATQSRPHVVLLMPEQIEAEATGRVRRNHVGHDLDNSDFRRAETSPGERSPSSRVLPVEGRCRPPTYELARRRPREEAAYLRQPFMVSWGPAEPMHGGTASALDTPAPGTARNDPPLDGSVNEILTGSVGVAPQ